MRLIDPKKHTMATQLTVMFSVLFIALGVLLLVPILSIMRALSVERLGDDLGRIVVTASLSLDGDKVSTFLDGDYEENDDWFEMRKQLRTIQEANGLEMDHVYVFGCNERRADELKFALMLHEKPFVGDTYQVPSQNQAIIREALSGTAGRTGIYEDAHGTWISAIAPVRNRQGDVTGLLQADHRVDSNNLAFNSALVDHLVPIIAIFGVVIFLGLLTVRFLTHRMIKPMAALANLTDEIARGQWDIQIPKMGVAELQRLGDAFERMRQKIYEQVEHLKDFNRKLEEKVEEKTQDLRKANEELEQQAEAIIEFQKSHDSLTHLGNRSWFDDKLALAVARCQQDGSTMGVAILGLDRFNRINETAGTPEGDRVLREIADRLVSNLKSDDVVARVDGDGFGMIYHDIRSWHDFNVVAKRILDKVAEPITLGDLEVTLTASLGISVYPNEFTEVGDLMRDAGTAMKKVKNAGGNGFLLYQPDMDEESANRLALESRMRVAIDKGEFQLYYQPQVDLSTGEVIGVESLVRWIDPEKGIISPGTFIPLAEESGLIVPLGKWIMKEACEARERWTQMGLHEFVVAVNLSGRQFEQDDLVDFVDQTLKETRIPPRLLELEITESIAMNNIEDTLERLDELHGMDVTLAIDDFGTGYSSLSYLKRFKVHKLKIDRSFVMDEEDVDNWAIVEAVVKMGHALKLKVIAEGVERITQLDFLKILKCDEYQGYYFSKPLPETELIELLQKTKKAQV